MKYSELYRLLRAKGWVLQAGQGKRHDKWTHPDYDYFIPVPRHQSKEVPIGTLRAIMRSAGLELTLLTLPRSERGREYHTNDKTERQQW